MLSGKDLAEIRVKFTGLRPGEKLYEELITAGEGVLETGHDKIMVLRADSAFAESDDKLALLVETAQCFDVNGVRQGLPELVPEYTPVRNMAEAHCGQ